MFCPPESIARDEPYCLFLDELNAATPDVQKAFYSLILDRRIGNYELPKGSIVIGAGNRATDNALARPISSALINRLTHVHLEASPKDWLDWAAATGFTRGSWTTSPTGPTTSGPSRRRPRRPSPRPGPGTCSPTRWAPSGPTSTRTP